MSGILRSQFEGWRCEVDSDKCICGNSSRIVLSSNPKETEIYRADSSSLWLIIICSVRTKSYFVLDQKSPSCLTGMFFVSWSYQNGFDPSPSQLWSVAFAQVNWSVSWVSWVNISVSGRRKVHFILISEQWQRVVSKDNGTVKWLLWFKKFEEKSCNNLEEEEYSSMLLSGLLCLWPLSRQY